MSADAPAAKTAPLTVPLGETIAPPKRTFRDFLLRAAKPVLAVALGAQLFLGAVGGLAAQASVVGASSPVKTELVSTVERGPGARLLARAEPAVARAEKAMRALRAAEDQRPIAEGRVEVNRIQQASAREVIAEVRASIAALEKKLAGERDPVERQIAQLELDDAKSRLADPQENLRKLEAERPALERALADAKRALRSAERESAAADRALAPFADEATAQLAAKHIALPSMIKDASLISLGYTPPSTEGERVLRFNARVEAWFERTGRLPNGEEQQALAMTHNRGVDWALKAMPRDVFIPASQVSSVQPFQLDGALPSVRALAQKLDRSADSIDVRDLEMFARHPQAQHAGFIALMSELSERSGNLSGPLSSFERLFALVGGDTARFPAAPLGSHALSRADLLAIAELARKHGQPLSAASIPFFALAIKTAGPVKANALWLLEHARFEGRAGEWSAAEHWSVFSREDLAPLLKAGRPLAFREIQALDGREGFDLASLRDHAVKDHYLAAHAELRTDRAALEASVKARLGAGVDRLDRDYSEDWSSALPRLSNAELQKIELLQTALLEPSTRAQLATLIRADLQESNAELGGRVLLDAAGRAIFAPTDGRGGGNNAFLLGPNINPFDCLASFHLHAATGSAERDHAGPSPGADADMGAAHARQLDGVVITWLGHDRVNVDFYTANGVVLDLGTIHLGR